MEEVRKFLKDCKVFFLATIDDEKPRVRPFGALEIFENHLYIETSKKKDVFKQIQRNGNVEICGYNGREWIRVSGELIIDDRIEAKKAIFDKDPILKNTYNPFDKNTIVMYFKSGKAIISSFEDEDIIINF